MKLNPKAAAKALAAVAAGPLSPEKEREIIKNFASIVTTRASRGHWPKFIAAAEKALREKEGLRKVSVTYARSSESLQGEVKKFLKPSDVLEEKIDPNMVAGLKIMVDDNHQYDGSLLARLNKLF